MKNKLLIVLIFAKKSIYNIGDNLKNDRKINIKYK